MTFPADEGLPIPTVTVDAPIQIFDDDVDEAERQVFIAYLELVSAVKEETVQLNTIVSACAIVDNDREEIIALRSIVTGLIFCCWPCFPHSRGGVTTRVQYTWTPETVIFQ